MPRRDLLDHLRPSLRRAVRGGPRIDAVTPTEGAVGSKVTLRGKNLHGCRFSFGTQPVRVARWSRDKVVVEVPRVRGTVQIEAVNFFGRATAPSAFTVKSSKTVGTFTFLGNAISHGGPGHSIVTSGTGQPYLILPVLPSDLALPAGTTTADVVTDTEGKLAGAMDSANDYWKEASYGKTSFAFDVHQDILNLPDPMSAYFQDSAPKKIQASGAAYPVTWVGDETLSLEGDDSFELTISFPAGDQTASEVVVEINYAIAVAWTDPGDPPISVAQVGGQLLLESGTDAADATLVIAGGTAVDALGLAADVVTVTAGIDKVDDDRKKVVDALEARIAPMSDADAKTYLSGFDGVGIVFAAGSLRASAGGPWNFDIRNEQYHFSHYNITTTYPWNVHAHEIGHNLGFPDLYDEPGGIELIGTEPANWDLMHCSYCDAHPSAWIKHHKTAGSGDQWMTSIEPLTAPPGTSSNDVEVLLWPTSAPMPTSNPFAATHPGIPLRHAVQVVVSEDRSLYVENRQHSFTSALGATQYDDEIPGEGVIVTDAVNTMDGLPVYRSWVVMATDYNDPLDVVGEEETVLQVTPLNSVRVRILEQVGTAPEVYRARVSWGQGSFFDYRLRDWTPPPWESPDIWIDTRVDNQWDEFSHSDPVLNPDVPGNPILNGDRSRVGWPSRVYARVWNDGDVARTNVRVQFQVVLPAGMGPTPGFDIGEDFIDLPAGGSALASVDWTPRDANEGHVCIRAMVDPDPDELNAKNNLAQENITDWYLEGSSPYVPVSFSYQVANPLARRALIAMQAQGLQPGWRLTVDRLQFWLEPDEVVTGHATLSADPAVPFEDVLVRERLEIPLVTLEAQVKYNDAWVSFGGISGSAHAVRRTIFEVNLDPAGSVVHVTGSAIAGGQPVQGANVTVRLLGPDATREIIVDSTRTDVDGGFSIRVIRGDPAEAVFIEAVLSPGLGTGPAEFGPVSIPT